jgi:peptidoglycan-N-acetylmuramic acid deacetylase
MIKKLTAFISAFIIMTSVLAFNSYNVSAQGYGQGTQIDEKNCPTGASDFNAMYGRYDAYALSSDKNTIILTFDQGYENGYTGKILDTLKEKNVKAIFFLTGDYAKKETELVNRMITEGHCIGNHGMKHLKMSEISENEIAEEVQSLHDLVAEKYGYEMQYLRPPCGEFTEESLKTVQDMGYKTIMWSFAYVDWNVDSQPDSRSSMEKIISSAHGGEIILLHSVSATNCEILGDVIDGLRAKGYNL